MTLDLTTKVENIDLPQPAGMATLSKLKGKSRPKKNGNWTNAQLEVAMRAVDKGAKVCLAVDYYGIPKTTFRAHIHGRIQSRK